MRRKSNEPRRDNHITTPTSGLITTEAGGTATFDVVLDTQPTGDVTIGISSSNTAEDTVSTASLTFTSANWSTAQTVTVTGVDDDLDDGDISYNIVTPLPLLQMWRSSSHKQNWLNSTLGRFSYCCYSRWNLFSQAQSPELEIG